MPLARTCLAGMLAATASAQSPRILGTTLPSRSEKAHELRMRADELARQMAKKLGGTHVPATQEAASESEVVKAQTRAHALSQAGAVDDAAATFDVALAAGAKEPHRLTDPAGFVAAHVQRASIALARGEKEVARKHLARLLRYDPTFALSFNEDSPRLREAYEDVRSTGGVRPPVQAEDLGDACAEADVIVIARPMSGGTVEFSRWDGCKAVSSYVGSSSDGDQALQSLLGLPAAPQPSPQVKDEPAWYSRSWIWITAGVVVAGSATALLLVLNRSEPGDDDGLAVVPHY